MSRFVVRPAALQTPAGDADRLAEDLAAVAASLARLPCPDTGSAAGTGHLTAVLQVLGARVQGLSVDAHDDARALRSVCASYLAVEHSVARFR